MNLKGTETSETAAATTGDLDARELLSAWCDAFQLGLSEELDTSVAAEIGSHDQVGTSLAGGSLMWLEQPLENPRGIALAFGVSDDFAHSVAHYADSNTRWTDLDARILVRDLFDRTAAALASVTADRWSIAPGVRERAGAPEGGVQSIVSIRIGNVPVPVLLVSVAHDFPMQLGRLAAEVGRPEAPRKAEPAQTEEPASPPAPASYTAPEMSEEGAGAMGMLLTMELPARILLGRSTLPLKEVLQLGAGSVIELNRSIDDSVELAVNNCIVAQGEIVVVRGHYGIRIKQINDRARQAASQVRH